MSGTILQFMAMRDAHVHVAAIHLRELYVVMEGGMHLPITGMYDEFGDETDDKDEAVAIDFGMDGVGYGTMPIEREGFNWDH